MPQFSQKSKDKLATCHPALQELCNRVVQHFDMTVIQGHRTKAEHAAYVKSGATKVAYEQSKHSSKPSLAVDIAPYPLPKDWGKGWRDRVKFYELKAVMFHEAAQMGIRLRWGGDWDGDYDYNDQTFDDLVHFELIT